MDEVRPGQHRVTHRVHAEAPRFPGGWRGFLLLLLPPPRSQIELWDDDPGVDPMAEITWTPSRWGLLLGDLPVVRYFKRQKTGADLQWIDAETGEVPNRWLRERLEESFRRARR